MKIHQLDQPNQLTFPLNKRELLQENEKIKKRTGINLLREAKEISKKKNSVPEYDLKIFLTQNKDKFISDDMILIRYLCGCARFSGSSNLGGVCGENVKYPNLDFYDNRRDQESRHPSFYGKFYHDDKEYFS